MISRRLALSSTWILATGLSFGQPTTLVSVNDAGVPGNGYSTQAAISSDGRYVVFLSAATNLVVNDLNNQQDIFVRDLADGTTSRIDVGPSGQDGNGLSYWPGISGDGRFVVFFSSSSNFVPGDGNAAGDIFVRDRTAGTITRVSVDASGREGNGWASHSAISGDGRFVAFASSATNLVPADFNGVSDVFVHDMATGETTRVSVDSLGGESNGASAIDVEPTGLAISADGRFVAFESDATNLSPPGSTGGFRNVFLNDRLMRSTIQVSAGTQTADGRSNVPSMSGDGRYVAFQSDATNLVANDSNGATDVFLFDAQIGSIERMSVGRNSVEGNASSDTPSISPDGRTVGFRSLASNFVVGDTNGTNDVFLHDRRTGVTHRMSVGSTGNEANSYSYAPSVSSMGLHVAFVSNARNLAPGVTGNPLHVYVRDHPIVDVDSVSPALGSVAGNEIARVRGSGFTTSSDTTVFFGTAAATLLEVTTDRITVRTPPGTGTVDVTVTSRGIVGTLANAFTYVAPEIAARYGNVNLGYGDRENVLLINAVAGDDVSREVVLSIGQPATVVMSSPSSRLRARFALFGWFGAPTPSTLRVQPFGVGPMVLPTPLDVGASPQPAKIGNNLDARLGNPTFPTTPAPVMVGRRPLGFSRPLTFTLQGFVQDRGSLIPQGVSVTNAVILRVVR